jgi:hypothetical protein
MYSRNPPAEAAIIFGDLSMARKACGFVVRSIVNDPFCEDRQVGQYPLLIELTLRPLILIAYCPCIGDLKRFNPPANARKLARMMRESSSEARQWGCMVKNLNPMIPIFHEEWSTETHIHSLKLKGPHLCHPSG